MDYLVDTNLWRALAVSDSRKSLAREVIKKLLRDGAELCVFPQNLIELWSVATRPPQENGFGKSIAATDRYCRYIQSFATLLPDPQDLFRKWQELVNVYQIAGKKVFDTRLAAAMILHNVPPILTFNTRDFARYSEIESVDPASV